MIDHNYAKDMADDIIAAQDTNGDGILQRSECDDVYASLFDEGDVDGNGEVNYDEMVELVYLKQLYVVPTDGEGNNMRQVGALLENGGEKMEYADYWNEAWMNIYELERDYYYQGKHDAILDSAECPNTYKKLFEYSDANGDGRVSRNELADTYQMYNVHEL